MDIRIAICDDEPKICAVLENMLIDILETRGVYYEIEPFYSGENLCVEIQRQIFDLIFLDIELKKKSGLDVSNYIRNELGNESVQIAYISAKTGYAMDLFEFRPINFLNIKREQIFLKYPCQIFCTSKAGTEKYTLQCFRGKMNFMVQWKMYIQLLRITNFYIFINQLL